MYDIIVQLYSMIFNANMMQNVYLQHLSICFVCLQINLESLQHHASVKIVFRLIITRMLSIMHATDQ